MYKKVKDKDGFLYAKGKLPVMLVAHMDTVHKQTPKTIYISTDGNKIKSDEGIGGDDRCGIYAIMNILHTTDFRPHILFTEDEEIGCIGASKFANRYNNVNLGINFIIEIDRRDYDDSVYYDNDNKDFEKFINSFGFKTQLGSFSDISEIAPALKVSAVNLSSGYYLPHTKDEYVMFNELTDTINKVKKILANSTTKYDYIEKKHNYKDYSKFDSLISDNWNNNWEDYIYGVDYNKSKKISKETHSNCSYCNVKINSSELEYDEFDYLICPDCARTYYSDVCDTCGCYHNNNNSKCEQCENIYYTYNKKEVDNNVSNR